MLKPIFHDPVKAASPRAALASLAEYLPVFTRPGFEFGSWTKPAPAGENTMVMGYFTIGPEAHAFMVGAYEHGWVREFDWPGWLGTPEAGRLLSDPATLAAADQDDLARTLTVCLRQDRFIEGGLNGWFEDGLLTRILQRAAVLLSELPLETARTGSCSSGPRAINCDSRGDAAGRAAAATP
jgi:hypothetical protein